MAKEAIQEASRNKSDVVLVDTAGRMQVTWTEIHWGQTALFTLFLSILSNIYCGCKSFVVTVFSIFIIALLELVLEAFLLQ